MFSDGKIYMGLANGERVYKLTGQSILGQVNSGSIKAQAIFDDAVLYPNPYVVVTSKGYTKHYYAGTERIATAIVTMAGWSYYKAGEYFANMVNDLNGMLNSKNFWGDLYGFDYYEQSR